MGINDRDYMRRAEPEPEDTPREIANRGLITAVCIVGALVFLGIIVSQKIAESEAEIREEREMEEHLQMLIRHTGSVTRETPRALKRLADVNHASMEELMEVPYVGESLATAIIANRPYASLEELDKVPGIGPRKIEILRPYLAIEALSPE